MDANLILQGIPLDQLLQCLGDTLRPIIQQEIAKARESELQNKLLSPAEVCKLFQPQPSKKTLEVWTQKGILKKYSLGGRVFYKYAEIMEAAKSIKHYSPLYKAA